MNGTGHRRTTAWAWVLIAVLSVTTCCFLFVAWAALARFDPFPSRNPLELSAKAEVLLTQDQPVATVEFEGTIETHDDDVVAYFDRVHPGTTEDMAALGAFAAEHWEDGEWVRLEGTTRSANADAGPYRFRWLLELPDDVSQVTIPIEAKFSPAWPGGSGMPPPDETEVGSVSFRIVDIRPMPPND